VGNGQWTVGVTVNKSPSGSCAVSWWSPSLRPHIIHPTIDNRQGCEQDADSEKRVPGKLAPGYFEDIALIQQN